MNKSTTLPFVMSGSAVLLGVLLSVYTPNTTYAADDSYTLEFGSRDKTSELRLSIGKSQIIYSPQILDQVVIGNPAVADIKLLSSRQVLILGNKPGHTNLVFRDKDRSLIAVMDVVVGYDLDGVKRKIYEALPNERSIEIRGANDSVILTGEVSSLLAMDAAVSVASSYVPKDKVVNQIQVGGGQQVMLEAKISEVARNSLKEFGFNMDAQGTAIGGRTFGFATGTSTLPPKLPFALASFGDSAMRGVFDSVDVTLRLLETKGLAKTLAEPNLVALSGQEASFLAGGEIPIPVAQSSSANLSAVTMQYKEFGVGLKFTPTVLTSQKINMKLNAEVSSLGERITTAAGDTYAINTRRTATTIEMADGQSFAVAGLMQSDMNNAINQVPGLGNIPVLGALFKSTKYQRNETELVIVVTPRLVMPVGPGKVYTPTDNIVPPSDMDMYLLGRLHGKIGKSSSSESDKSKASTNKSGSAATGGIDGTYGHQVK